MVSVQPSSSSFRGLAQREVTARLARFGANELPRDHGRSLARIALGVASEPVFQLLLAAGAIYLVLGDVTDAVILMFFVATSAAISIVQERRSERVLDSLRDLSSPRAIVIRSSEQQRIAGVDVVVGDLMLLTEGDRVAADAVLLSATELQVDESLLSGESVAVEKICRSGPEPRPRVYSGTLVVKGAGVARVIATGTHTEMGRIGAAVSSTSQRPSLLARDSMRLTKIFTAIALAVSAAVILGYGLSGRGWLDAALSGITVAMGLIPEEFAVVFAVFMAMGAWRMSRHRVLARQRAAIEALGSASVLCTDKTGTLTINDMRLRMVADAGGAMHRLDAHASAQVMRIVQLATLACDPRPTDPMERAFFKALHGERAQGLDEPPSELPVREYRWSAEFPAMTNVWRTPDASSELHAVMKGALEVVLARCGLSHEAMESVRSAADEMASQGLRVLAVASARVTPSSLPNQQQEFAMTLTGLVGLADPLRDSVPQAVAQCQQAGIRVVMITGDYPTTAWAIARESGIVSAGDDMARCMLTGEALETLSDHELAELVRDVKVFARTRPVQKLRIVRALQSGGQVVAMTGDGVNDAPALKAADIGIAMGSRGTDVARESASLVLLDDDFGSIVQAIARGRQIFSNLRKAIGFVITVHVPMAGLAALPLVMGQPMIFLPMHLGFLEMIIDPASSLVFESEPAEPDLMQRPPRDPNESLYPAAMLAKSVAQGAAVFGLLALAYVGLNQLPLPHDDVRALMFVGFVFCGFAVILASMGPSGLWRRAAVASNRPLMMIMGGTLLTLVILFALDVLREAFRFGSAPVLWLLAAAALCLPAYGVLRLLARWPQHSRPNSSTG